ncbi:hypothetical protein CISG_07827 [Coccidioides immitis RMSCC 3703]|uniref:Uncharacterized protein n=2 Tax=Coccidioides immitis TaxID=5501 RepID=A0A0J8TZB0_COCIT|nr:hypothetical protein CIRG_10341 [Coccidioides immitis RMSCC 2394]KMU79342.1 hypothetical protein CISG_07827 [Coccidioides immitis RMSCC 3703]
MTRLIQIQRGDGVGFDVGDVSWQTSWVGVSDHVRAPNVYKRRACAVRPASSSTSRCFDRRPFPPLPSRSRPPSLPLPDLVKPRLAWEEETSQEPAVHAARRGTSCPGDDTPLAAETEMKGGHDAIQDVSPLTDLGNIILYQQKGGALDGDDEDGRIQCIVPPLALVRFVDSTRPQLRPCVWAPEILWELEVVMR